MSHAHSLVLHTPIDKPIKITWPLPLSYAAWSRWFVLKNRVRNVCRTRAACANLRQVPRQKDTSRANPCLEAELHLLLQLILFFSLIEWPFELMVAFRIEYESRKWLKSANYSCVRAWLMCLPKWTSSHTDTYTYIHIHCSAGRCRWSLLFTYIVPLSYGFHFKSESEL